MKGLILRTEALRSSQIRWEDQRAITHRVVRLEPTWYDLQSTSVSNTPSRANVIYDQVFFYCVLFFAGGGGGGGENPAVTDFGLQISEAGTYSVHNYLELETNRQVLKTVLSPKSLYFGENPIRLNAQLFSLNWLDLSDFNTFFDKCVHGSLPITYNIALCMFYQYEVSIVVTSQKDRE